MQAMPSVGGVRQYNRIRRFLGQIYLYGCFSREDFARTGIGSAKDYDYGARLIRSIFPEAEDAALWRDGKKYLRIQREYARSGENRMADSYLLHSLDEQKELPETLWILCVLARGPKTLDELCKEVELHCEEETVSKYATVRRRVLELVQYGYIEKTKKVCSAAPDVLRRLDDPALERLYEYVRFAGGTTYPRVAGSFLRRTLEREFLRRGLCPEKEAAFLLRHSVSSNVFDEEIVYQLLDMLGQGHTAVLDLDGRRRAVLPAALRADARLGRWYLLYWEQGPAICRISRISGIEPGTAVPEEEREAAAQETARAFAHAGCSGAIPETGPVLVEAKLCFGAFRGMQAQFARELRIGELVDREDGTYYQARIHDPLELLPLLRSYAPWLRVLPGQHDLDRRLREDLLQMRRAVLESV